MPSAPEDVGPVMPPRGAVRAIAMELHALSRIALDCTTDPNRPDLPRALEKFERMRAILGEGSGG